MLCLTLVLAVTRPARHVAHGNVYEAFALRCGILPGFPVSSLVAGVMSNLKAQDRIPTLRPIRG